MVEETDAVVKSTSNIEAVTNFFALRLLEIKMEVINSFNFIAQLSMEHVNWFTWHAIKF